ncbi:ZapG family protein [Paraglaciecola sp.]|uniref:ZapG family protein n=1 Tax=Paraglaciecola sp. TaxID=1920173 RepID=UPI003EF25744
MDWIIGVLLLIVGGIIGYFVAKHFSEEDKNQQNSAENEQTVQEIMAQQASVHLIETKKIAEQLSQQAESLTQQVSHYEQVLISQKSGAEEDQLNYFGEHAATYLRNKTATPAREKDKAEVQPLDFSSESSGLFSGNAETEDKQVK